VKQLHYYISRGSTVNLRALDVPEAFDKMNHHELFVKLMERRILNEILLLLQNWFRIGVTCIKWGNVFSVFMRCHVEFDKAVLLRFIYL